MVLAASGRPDSGAALGLHQPDADMLIARLPAGGAVELPGAPLAHVFVARGAAVLETDSAPVPLAAGDAVRLSWSQGERLTASEPTEIIVWALGSGPA